MSAAACTAAPLDEAMFCARVFAARPGERIEYHRGFLVLDRSPLGGSADRETRSELIRVAERAFALAERGLVHLVQKRIAPERFSYMAVIRPKRQQAGVLLADIEP